MGQRILDAVIKQQDLFHAMHDTQNALLGTLYNEMALVIKDEHTNTRRAIADKTSLSIQTEHATTRREIIQEIRVRHPSGH
jgi:hypothetical protein